MPDSKSINKVFISHSSKDALFAGKVAEDLKRAGFEPWIAPESIKPGDNWVDALQRGLSESAYFILVLTPEAIASKWVKLEVNTAIRFEVDGKLAIIPIEYKHCTEIPPFWDNHQKIDFVHDYKQGLKTLLIELSHIMEEPSPTQETVNIIETSKGLFRVPGVAFMDGRDPEAKPPLTVMNINLWDSVPRRRRICSVQHGTEVKVLQEHFDQDENRYYFLIRSSECQGWVSEPFLSPKFNQSIGDEIA